MSSMVHVKSRVNQQKITQSPSKLIYKLCKLLLLSAVILYAIYVLSPNRTCCRIFSLFITNSTPKFDSHGTTYSPTKINHLVFGIAGSSNTWKAKKWYIESWWKPNITRGYLFLNRPPTKHLPWPYKIDPPYRISEDISKYKRYDKHLMPHAIRMVRVIAEVFGVENKGVRWYVMADDDTVLFVDNLIEVLNKYDHREYYYVGRNSECVVNNVDGSFEMGFGGAGYALSYPLAEALAKNLDVCIERYPYVYGSDHILQSCVADMGVSLTHEKGFHQIDLRGDISGLLSAHPQSPLLSLHHLDAVNPIFPFMTRYDAVSHLKKAAAAADESRLLQQSVCYHKPQNWTLSLSWGYSVQIYETIFPPSVLQRPLETFSPWRKGAWPPYVFSTRRVPEDPCEAPHVLLFDSVEEKRIGASVVMRYTRRLGRNLGNCSSSADHIQNVQVVSPVGKLGWVGGRRECCDVLQVSDANDTELLIKLRTCKKDEIVG